MSSAFAPYVVGIDLGTTNTLCATWRQGDPAPALLRIRQPITGVRLDGYQSDDRGLLPSAVAVLPPAAGGVIVGALARNLARQGHQQNVVLSVKRRMGTEWVQRIGGEDWTAERLSGCILKAVHKQITTTFPRPPERVVITIPASFGTEARRATLRAAALAGFDPRATRLFDEPVAALLHHVLPADARGLSAAADGARLMMIDIGGGTFDVSVLRLVRAGGGTEIDIEGRSRYTELAGDDFDLSVAGLLLYRYERATGPLTRLTEDEQRRVCSELLLAAEAAKVRLVSAGAAGGVSRRGADAVREPVEVRGPDHVRWSGELSLGDVWYALQPFFWQDGARVVTPDQAARAGYSFFRPIGECLRNVGDVTGRPCGPEDIDRVYLSGGSAQLPMIGRAVQQLLPRSAPELVTRPMQAVALGAAWYAGVLAGGFVRERIALRERLFEGVYLQLGNKTFRELLSPRDPVPVKRRPVGQIRMTDGRADQRVDFALFSGADRDDIRMVPLARRRVGFGKVLPPRHVIDLWIEVSADRQIFIDCQAADPDGGPALVGEVEVSADLENWQRERAAAPGGGLGRPLPDVNVPLPGPGGATP